MKTPCHAPQNYTVESVAQEAGYFKAALEAQPSRCGTQPDLSDKINLGTLTHNTLKQLSSRKTLLPPPHWSARPSRDYRERHDPPSPRPDNDSRAPPRPAPRGPRKWVPHRRGSRKCQCGSRWSRCWPTRSQSFAGRSPLPPSAPRPREVGDPRARPRTPSGARQARCPACQRPPGRPAPGTA